MLAQIELFANNKNGKRPTRSMCCRSRWTRSGARLHLAEIGVRLTGLRKDQADISVSSRNARSSWIMTGIEVTSPLVRLWSDSGFSF
jgi:hypothetical protein